MALIKIKQINNSPAATGGVVMFDGTNNVWSNNDTNAIQASSGTTGERPTGTNGMVRYNTTLGCLESFVAGSWECLFDSSGGTLSIEQIIGADSATSEPMAFIIDTTRSSKVLSTESSALTFGEGSIGNDDWLAIGGVSDAESSYIMPYDGTIVRATGHTVDDNGNTKTINIFVEGSLAVAAGTFPGTSAASSFEDTDINTNFTAGERIRTRGDSASGTVQDIVVTLWVKWRTT